MDLDRECISSHFADLFKLFFSFKQFLLLSLHIGLPDRIVSVADDDFFSHRLTRKIIYLGLCDTGCSSVCFSENPS